MSLHCYNKTFALRENLVVKQAIIGTEFHYMKYTVVGENRRKPNTWIKDLILVPYSSEPDRLTLNPLYVTGSVICAVLGRISCQIWNSSEIQWLPMQMLSLLKPVDTSRVICVPVIRHLRFFTYALPIYVTIINEPKSVYRCVLAIQWQHIEKVHVRVCLTENVPMYGYKVKLRHPVFGAIYYAGLSNALIDAAFLTVNAADSSISFRHINCANGISSHRPINKQKCTTINKYIYMHLATSLVNSLPSFPN
jgi:hypothetical protein